MYLFFAVTFACLCRVSTQGPFRKLGCGLYKQEINVIELKWLEWKWVGPPCTVGEGLLRRVAVVLFGN